MKSMENSVIFSLLKKNRLFGSLEETDVKELIALGIPERHGANEIIFSKGDSGVCLYAILRGRVGIQTISKGGKVMILNLLEAGDVFGEIAMLDGRERTAGAVTLQASEFLRINRADFLVFLEKRPKLCIHLMNFLCERLRWTSDIIEDTIFLDVPRRLAKRLIFLAGLYGKNIDSGLKINEPISQEYLANMLGVTREIINKTMRVFQEKNAICYNNGFIVISDMEFIKDIAS